MALKSLPRPSIGWKLRLTPIASRNALVVARIVAVLLALLVSAVVIKLSGLSPIALGAKALKSSLGSEFALEQLGLLLTPILITAVAAASALRMGLWNIGIDGQLYIGAVAVTGVGLFVDGPNFLMLLVLSITGMVGGALWVLLPALARAYANVNEIISTLMLNFVAILIVNYLATGPWRDKTGAGVMAASARIPFALPEFFGALHIGLFLGMILLGVFAFVSRFTQFAYETDLVGANNHIGSYMGVRTEQRIVVIMLVSGAIAGLAGMIEVTGNVHRLQYGISNQFGIFGIIAAVLGRGSPIGIAVGSVFIAFVLNSGLVMQSAGLSLNSVIALTGLVLLAVASAEVLARYKLARSSANLVRSKVDAG
jgi:general nucleoside transport system permease protein